MIRNRYAVVQKENTNVKTIGQGFSIFEIFEVITNCDHLILFRQAGFYKFLDLGIEELGMRGSRI